MTDFPHCPSCSPLPAFFLLIWVMSLMSDLRLLLISGVKHASSRLEWDLLAHAACLQLSAIPQQQAVIRIKDQCFKRFGFPSISAENQQNSIFPLGEKYAVSNAGRRLPPSRCYRRETDGRTHVTCTSPLSALDSAHTCRTAHLDGLVPSLKPQNEKHRVAKDAWHDNPSGTKTRPH